MSTTVQLVTADELFLMPRDGFRYELVKGELRRMSPAGFEHGAIVINVSLLLAQHVRANKLGRCVGAEAGFKIASDPDTVLAPDLSFISREHLPESGLPKNFWRGVPDLAVEVVGPGDTSKEVKEKVADWLAAGTKAVWIVNPKRRSVFVYRSITDVTRLSESDELDGGDVVPGFRCKVADLFV